MRGYMDYLEETFLEACGWDMQSSYANIIVASRNILDFEVPAGVSLNLTSQASPASFSSWTLSNLDSIRGSMAYLYTSKSLALEPSRDIDLEKLVQCYRQPALKVGESPIGLASEPRKGTMLYGRMFLPGQAIECMAIAKFTSFSQLVTKWIVDPRLIQPVVATFTWQAKSVNKSTREFIYSTHENLIGFRTLYNVAEWTNESESQLQSRLAAGLEVFFAASKKSPGISLASRYSTYSRYTGTPLTLTFVTNPIVGTISVAYALKPTRLSAFSSRFLFNFYSYDSDLTLGCELWRNEPISAKAEPEDRKRSVLSVLKASVSLANQSARILWEGAYRSWLVSLGSSFCYTDPSRPIRFGVEFSYAS